MKRYRLDGGISGVSAVSLGTTGLGTQIAEADSFRLMDAYPARWISCGIR